MSENRRNTIEYNVPPIIPKRNKQDSMNDIIQQMEEELN